MCLVLNGYEDMFGFADEIPSDIFLWRSINSDVQKRKVDTRDGLIGRIFYAAVSQHRKREYQLRRTKRYLRTRVAN